LVPKIALKDYLPYCEQNLNLTPREPKNVKVFGELADERPLEKASQSARPLEGVQHQRVAEDRSQINEISGDGILKLKSLREVNAPPISSS